MPIVSHTHKFVYFPVPKNGSSSIKQMIFTIETGQDFREVRKSLQAERVHSMYPADKRGSKWQTWYNSYWTFALVRDPTSRLLSAYQNRIIDRGRISDSKSKRHLSRAGLPTAPTLEEFIENLPIYRKHSHQIRKHTEPQSIHLKDVFSRTKDVFPIERIGELMRMLNERCGTSATPLHVQKSKKKLSKSDLSDRHRAVIRDYYAEDYEMLSDYYSP